ncbi:MAG: ABC transporter permease [Thermodesulfobacteriota bacterium]|nr:ABC transporter permease [Thermodesulfobacteriota bacterium]
MTPAVYSMCTIWHREIKRYWRAKSRIVGSLGMPFFFFALLGTGLSPGVTLKGGSISYLEFIAPGIIGMVLIFTSTFSGLSVIWDRQFGFLKEIMVAPVSRSSIVLGKTLGGATTSLIQGLLMLVLIIFIGARVGSIQGFLISLFIMILISISFVSLGISFSAFIKDVHGYQLVMNFLIMPIFFLSGALFPLSGLPPFLRVFAYIDPLTYGVDALRYAFLGVSDFPFLLDICAIIIFSALMVTTGTFLFKRVSST